MYRSIATNAIVIRRERLGEQHKSLWLLTADLGLIPATAYGACRMNSRLRMGSEPFTWSLARLYHNPVKHAYKVTELEIRDSFPGLQREVCRLAAASLWAEVVQKSYGAGELSGGLLRLFLDGLRLLERAEPRREPYVTIQVLWRFLAMAGYQPDTGSCDRCGASLAAARSVVLLPSGHSFLCTACGAGQGTAIPAGSLRYLDASQALPIASAAEIVLEEASLGALRSALPRIVQSVLEGELVSLRLAGSPR